MKKSFTHSTHQLEIRFDHPSHNLWIAINHLSQHCFVHAGRKCPQLDITLHPKTLSSTHQISNLIRKADLLIQTRGISVPLDSRWD